MYVPSHKNRVVSIYGLKSQIFFKKKKRSSRRIFLQKYFAQKIQNKKSKHPHFFMIFFVEKLKVPFLGDGI